MTRTPQGVIQIVQHLKPGGIEVMALDLMQGNGSIGPSSTISLEGSAEESLKAWPRLEPYAQNLAFLNKATGFQLGTILRLARLFAKHKPQAIHSHHIGPLLYGGLAARLAGVPTILHTEHDAWHLESPKRQRLAKTVLSLVRPIVVADALLVKERFERLTGCHVDAVIPNGVDLKTFHPADKAAARKSLGLEPGLPGPIFGAAGRLTWVKGFDRLLTAFTQTPETARLVIAGEGEDRQALKSQAHSLGLSARVTFLGRLDSMAPFYQALDHFVMPSRKEGYPLSLIEAQACGVSVVTTDVGAAREATCPLTGHIVPADDFNALTRALITPPAFQDRPSPRRFAERVGNREVMVQRYQDLTA